MIGFDLPGATLSILIGPGVTAPAPGYVAEALESVQVTHDADNRSGFQLVFNADRTSAFSPDYPLLLSQLLSVGMRVVLVVTLSDGLPRTLSDGFITNMQLAHGKVHGTATITITGEDVGIIMDRIELSLPSPEMSHLDMVAEALTRYGWLGLIPVLTPPPVDLPPPVTENTPMQNDTDRGLIEALARQHGFVFMIRPGPAPMTNLAYWGPPPRIGLPQKTLSMDMGPATNVNTMNFTFDGLRPTRVAGLEADRETDADVPILTMESLRIPLAARPAMMSVGPMARTRLYNRTGLDAATALAYAQALTDKSTDDVVTVTGEVDTMIYGSVIEQPGLITVRGAGLTFDGFYFVKSVTHALTRGEYKQQFTLSREGLMPLSTIAPP